jgi:hypothetical protein
MMPPTGKRAIQIQPAVMSSVKKVEASKKESPYKPFALQISQGVTIFREFPLKPLIITDPFQTSGNIRVSSVADVSDAKGFRFKINRVSRKLTGKLDIFKTDVTEKWFANKLCVTKGGKLSQIIDLFRRQAKTPKSVAALLKLTFRKKTLFAEIMVNPLVNGKADNRSTVGIGMLFELRDVTPFKQ